MGLLGWLFGSRSNEAPRTLEEQLRELDDPLCVVAGCSEDLAEAIREAAEAHADRWARVGAVEAVLRTADWRSGAPWSEPEENPERDWAIEMISLLDVRDHAVAALRRLSASAAEGARFKVALLCRQDERCGGCPGDSARAVPLEERVAAGMPPFSRWCVCSVLPEVE